MKPPKNPPDFSRRSVKTFNPARLTLLEAIANNGKPKFNKDGSVDITFTNDPMCPCCNEGMERNNPEYFDPEDVPYANGKDWLCPCCCEAL